MADPRFYSVAGPFTLKKLAEISQAQIGGDANSDALFSDVAPLASAGPDDVAFLDNREKGVGVLVAKGLDITPGVLERLDTALPSLKVSDPGT